MKFETLRSEYNLLNRSAGEVKAQLDAKTAAHTESMNAILNADKLLSGERAKVASLTAELEATKTQLDSLMRQFSQQRIFSNGKGLGLGFAPVIEPNSLKGLQEFAERFGGQPRQINKPDEDNS